MRKVAVAKAAAFLLQKIYNSYKNGIKTVDKMKKKQYTILAF